MTTSNNITQFKNEYRWLSNFYKSPFVFKDLFEPEKLITYPTVEHFYQSRKCINLVEYDIMLQCKTPGETKLFGKTIKINPCWDHIKFGVMKQGIYQKFLQNLGLRTQLINTGDVIIQEGNYWGDKYWGVCLKTNTGENNLGKIIMLARTYFKSIESTND